DVASGSQRRPSFKGHIGSVDAVAFTADDAGIVSLGLEQEPKEQLNLVKLWDGNSGQEIARFKHPRGALSMAITPDRKMLATGGWDRTVRYWDLTANKEVKQLTGDFQHNVVALAFSPDGKTIFTSTANAEGRLWNVDPGTVRQRFDASIGTTFSHAAFSPNGKTVATAIGDGALVIWDTANGREQARLRGHSGHVKALAFTPGGETLLAGAT